MAETSEIDVTKMSLDELKEECRKLNLKVSGNKVTLQQRVRTAMERRGGTDGGTREDSTDEEDEEDEEEPHEREVKRESLEGASAVVRQPLAFRDVEDSLQTFSGDSRQNVRRWLEDFNETSEICLWTESQKIIYAKKLLRGSAKLFVAYESCCRTWKKLEKALVSEFGKTVNSKQVHTELARTKKKHDESYHEYVYRMMEIASHADLETEAKIQYIIDGIQDDPANKSILYGAQNIRELRKKLTQYEAMKKTHYEPTKNAGQQKSKQQNHKPSKSGTTGPGEQGTKTDEKRCYNCGEKNHLGASCPVKAKGTKCFNCGEFGHIAARCGKQERPKQVNECTVVSKRDNKIYKTVSLEGMNIVALLDTGSDLNLVRAEQYIKLAFTSHAFRQYCEEQNIQHILCTTGVPRGNGQVERANRMVIPVLSKLAAPKTDNWYKYVDQVQQYINASPSRSTGFSPFEVLTGRNMRLKDDVVLQEFIEQEDIRTLQEDRDQLREQASEAIEKVQRENRLAYNRKRKKHNIYRTGELVAIRRTQFAPGNKLNPKYLGPYKIESAMGRDRFRVSRIGEHAGPRITTTSVDNMKRWLADESDVTSGDSDVSDDDARNAKNEALTMGHQGLMPSQDGRVVGPRSPVRMRLRPRLLSDSTHARGQGKAPERQKRS